MPVRTPTAAVLGSGTMGTALANAIAGSGRECVLWSESPAVAADINERRRHPLHFGGYELAPGLRATTSIEDAVAGAECAIVAVRSEDFRALAARLRGLLGPDVPIASATKGVELRTGKCMSTLLAEETGGDAVGAIAGPNLAYDIIEDRPTALVVASASERVSGGFAALLRSERRHVLTTRDIRGVEWMGVLKNVVAIGVGIAGGLGHGDNARAALFALGLLEIGRLASRRGARPETLAGLAAVGDLFLTTTSSLSRNHWVGLQLGRGMPVSQLVRELADLQETAEGLHSTRVARALAVAEQVPAPITEAVYQVVAECRPPAAVFDRLLTGAALFGRAAT